MTTKIKSTSATQLTYADVIGESGLHAHESSEEQQVLRVRAARRAAHEVDQGLGLEVIRSL